MIKLPKLKITLSAIVVTGILGSFYISSERTESAEELVQTLELRKKAQKEISTIKTDTLTLKKENANLASEIEVLKEQKLLSRKRYQVLQRELNIANSKNRELAMPGNTPRAKRKLEKEDSKLAKTSIKTILDPSLSPQVLSVSFDVKNSFLQNCDEETQFKLDAWMQFIFFHGHFASELEPNKRKEFIAQLLKHKPEYIKQNPELIAYLYSITSDLAAQYENIQSIPNWGSLFAEVRVTDTLRSTMATLHKNGFKPSDKKCLAESADMFMAPRFNIYVSYDNWLTTFWLRRFQEGNMNQSLQVLSMINNLLAPKVKENQITFEKNVVWKTESWPEQNKEKDHALIEKYEQYIIGRKVFKDKVSVLLDGENLNLENSVLYPLSEKYKDQSLSFLEKSETTFDEGTNGLPFKTNRYDFSPENYTLRNPVTIFSLEKNQQTINLYEESKLSEKEKVNLTNLIEQKISLDWSQQFDVYRDRSCTVDNLKIKKLTNNRNSIYVVSKSCLIWGGEGTYGPMLIAIINTSDNGDLKIQHFMFDTINQIELYDYFADIDEDKNIELIIYFSSGVGGSTSLVELNESSWDTIIRFSEGAEGFVDYYDMTHNKKALEKLERSLQ